MPPPYPFSQWDRFNYSLYARVLMEKLKRKVKEQEQDMEKQYKRITKTKTK